MWLRENIHNRGNFLKIDELLQESTDEKLNLELSQCEVSSIFRRVVDRHPVNFEHLLYVDSAFPDLISRCLH